MAMKKIVLGMALAVVMAGCATDGERKGVQADDLRKSTYFVTERLLGEMNFVSVQRNLFQHRAACGSAPRFVMHERETGYASLIETADIPQSYENVVLADLIQYPESFRSSQRVAVRVYSYYYNDDVQKRVDRMLNAVQRPGVCDPSAEPVEPAPEASQ